MEKKVASGCGCEKVAARVQESSREFIAVDYNSYRELVDADKKDFLNDLALGAKFLEAPPKYLCE